jgi:hypothetical protein
VIFVLQVYMRDIKDDFVKKGLQHVEDSFNGKVKRKRLSPAAAAQLTSLVTGGTDIQPFARCQILIEVCFVFSFFFSCSLWPLQFLFARMSLKERCSQWFGLIVTSISGCCGANVVEEEDFGRVREDLPA